MKAKLLLLLICLSNFSWAQNNNQAFEWAFNTKAGINTVKQIKYDPQGNLFVLGSISMKGKWGATDIPCNPKASSYPGTGEYLGKISQSGTQTFIKSLNNPAAALTCYLMDIDAQGNVFILGSAKASSSALADFGNGVTLNANGYFLLKLNASGVAQWAKTYSMGLTSWSAFTNASGFKILPNGDMFLSIYCPNTPYKYWLLKTNAAGEEIWHRESVANTLSVGGFNCASSGQWVDEVGNSFITKYTTETKITLGSDSIIAPATPGAYLYVFAIDPTGKTIWQNAYSNAEIVDYTVNSKTSEITMIYVQTGKNNAPFDSLIYTGLPFPSLFKGLVKTSITGTKINYKPFSVFDSIRIGDPKKIIGLPDGSTAMWSDLIKESSAFIKGQFISLNNSKDQDLFIETNSSLQAKYLIALEKGSNSSSVNLASYQNKVGVSGDLFLPKDTLITINKTTLAAGTNDPTFSKDFPIFANIRTDVYIAQWDRSLEAGATSALKENKLTASAILFPNPFTDILNLQSTQNIQEISIINLAGQVVWKNTFNHKQISLNLETLEPGIYFLCYKNDFGSDSKKIIKY
ncbi:MAG: T9SS type A sorting domain-containing protein [bacterium]|nr:T9SS type A sorting domain-containing protein [bacterium]